MKKVKVIDLSIGGGYAIMGAFIAKFEDWTISNCPVELKNLTKALELEEVEPTETDILFKEIKDEINWKGMNEFYAENPFNYNFDLTEEEMAVAEALKGENIVFSEQLKGNALTKGSKAGWLVVKEAGEVLAINNGFVIEDKKTLFTTFVLNDGRSFQVFNDSYNLFFTIVLQASRVRGVAAGWSSRLTGTGL